MLLVTNEGSVGVFASKPSTVIPPLPPLAPLQRANTQTSLFELVRKDLILVVSSNVPHVGRPASRNNRNAGCNSIPVL